MTRLLDIDWKLMVTAGNSNPSKVGNTYVQLRLKTNNGSQEEHKFLNMPLPQFYKFLHELEKAKAAIEYIS